MDEMKHWQWGVVGLLLVAVYFMPEIRGLVQEIRGAREPIGSTVVPDTTVNERYEAPEIRYVEVPVAVTVYEQPDTNLRKHLDTTKVIAGIELNRNLLSVTTIAPDGTELTSEYTLKDLRRAQIDGNGRVQIDRRAKRRRFWRKVAVGAGVAVAGVVAFLVVK